MNKPVNVSAIAEIKSSRAFGKLAPQGANAIPAELLSFEQLLGDSASLIADLAAAPSGRAEGESVSKLDGVELIEVTAPASAAVAENPAVSLVQVWQSWLDGAGNEVPISSVSNSSESEGQDLTESVSVMARSQGTRLADAREAAVVPGSAPGEGEEANLAMDGNADFSTALTQAASTNTEVKASEQDSQARVEMQSAVGAAHSESRKAPAVAVQVLQIATPLHAAEWSTAFSDQISLLVSNGGGKAELRLNPAELGPIEVSLNVLDDRVQASFTVHHAATLDVLQAALPKLEQMMADRGVQLDSVSLESSEGGGEAQSRQADGGAGEKGRRSGRDTDTRDDEPVRRLLVRRGLVDTFA